MRVVVHTQPEPVVSLEEAKARLKIVTVAEDDLIEALVKTATQSIDGPTGWLGRAIGQQTLDAWFDNFGAGQFALPYPPIVEIDTVAYISSATGSEIVIAAEQYEKIGDRIASARGKTWPTPAWRREAVRVRYQAGYDEVPEAIKTAILLMTGDLYRNRETTSAVTMSAVPMSLTVESLLAPFRVFT